MFTVTFSVLHPGKLCYMCRGQTDIPPSYAHHKMVPFFQAHSLLLSIPQETKSVKIYVSCFFLIPLLYDIGGKSCFSQCLLHFCRIIQFFKRSTVNPVSPILSRFDHSIVSQKEQLCLQCPGIFFQIKNIGQACHIQKMCHVMAAEDPVPLEERNLREAGTI